MHINMSTHTDMGSVPGKLWIKQRRISVLPGVCFMLICFMNCKEGTLGIAFSTFILSCNSP